MNHTHWYDLYFLDYEEDEDDYFVPKYRPFGWDDKTREAANKSWNAQQYEAIQSEGNEVFEEYWDDKMRKERRGEAVSFPNIEPIARAKIIETFEPEFQKYFWNKIDGDSWLSAQKYKLDIALINALYTPWYRSKTIGR